MHDHVHDLACSVSGMKNGGSTDFHRFRYLYLKAFRDVQSLISQKQAKHLRTLFFQGTIEQNMFTSFTRLHVLKLVGFGITELPKQIENLIHLRYLDIFHTSIKCLPDYVGKLYNLQTLRILELKKWPNTIINLINLRHLYIGSTELPPGIGQLTCLQKLSNYGVRREKGYGIGELGSLKNLRGRLTIRSLELVSDTEEAANADLFGKANIFHLCFEWGNSRRDEINDEKVLEGLQPPQDLKSLQIVNYKSKNFPWWTMKMEVRPSIEDCWVGLNSLTDIKLEDCECEEIPMLGQLPHLKSLFLFDLPNVKTIGLKFYGIESNNASNNIFPALKSLQLCDMQSLTEWAAPEAAITVFSCLTYLAIQNCPQLRSVPSHFTSLEKLYFKDVDSCLPITHICDGNLSSLKDICIQNVTGCECEEIPMFGQLPHLKSLVLSGLPNVKTIGLQLYGIVSCNTSSNIFPALEKLELKNMSSLTDWVDPGVATTIFPCLKDLSISCCPRLKSAPSHFVCLKKLLFENVDLCSPLTHICDGDLTSLEALKVSDIPGLISLPDGLFVKNQNLKYLHIQDCPNLKRLAPCSLGGGASLEHLLIHECENLRELFIDLHRLQSLKRLEIIGCPKLMSISYQNNGESQGGFISLLELYISDCQELTTLPLELREDCGEQLERFQLRDLPNLTYPEVIGCLPKMTHLSCIEVINVPKLMNFPIDCNSLRGLKDLDITPFSDSRDIFYNTLRGIFQVSQSLQTVSLSGNECWEFLPDQLQHLTALQTLKIYDFGSIEVLPEWLGNISSLRVLVVENCKKLRDLPSKETIQRLTNLRHLWIMDSPLVKEKYSENGYAFLNSVWSKDFPSLSVKIL